MGKVIFNDYSQGYALNRITKLCQIIVTRSYFMALLKGAAAGVEHEKPLRNLGCRSVVDIGANRGQFALAAHRSMPQTAIVSFEPLKEPAAIFRRVFSSHPRVSLHDVAIGPQDRDMTIHVSRADDSSSLLPIAPLQSNLFPGTEEKEQRTIRVRRLDSILDSRQIEQPALLKIDVQGFEKDVLEGCKSLLPCFSYIYVECSFMELYAGQALAHEVVTILDKCGFILTGIYNLYYSRDGLAVQGDFLFTKKHQSTAKSGTHQ